MFTYILLGIIAVSLLAIIVIVIKKFPYLSSLNTSELQREKENVQKQKILSERLKRKTKGFVEKATYKLGPIGKFFRKIYAALYSRAKILEQKYQMQLNLSKKPDVIKQRIRTLLEEGKEYIDKEEWSEAENRYIEVLSFEPKHIEAYKALGDVYVAKKDYLSAQQTFEHILKLDKKLIDVYIDLSEVLCHLGKDKKALEQLQKGLDIEPNNPRNLAAVLTLAVEMKNFKIASQTLHTLESANPDNKKLSEWKEKVRALKKEKQV